MAKDEVSSVDDGGPIRDLEDRFKFTTRSAPEVQEAIALFMVKLKRDGVVFGGKAIRKEVVVNAMLLWLTALPYESALDVLGQACALLREELAQDISVSTREIGQVGGLLRVPTDPVQSTSGKTIEGAGLGQREGSRLRGAAPAKKRK